MKSIAMDFVCCVCCTKLGNNLDIERMFCVKSENCGAFCENSVSSISCNFAV